MALEYYTVKFPNDSNGVAQKNAYTSRMVKDRWFISGESVEKGHVKGEEVCCGLMVCLPFAFLAGRTPGFIVVNYAREIPSGPSKLFCQKCGVALPPAAKFCKKCGYRLTHVL